MKHSKSATAIRLRLEYDWIVLLFGLFLVLAQLLFQGELVYFLTLVYLFGMIEVLAVAAYRSLLNGEEGYHILSRKTLDQQSSVELIVFCMVFDFALLIAFSIIFLVKLIG